VGEWLIKKLGKTDRIPQGQEVFSSPKTVQTAFGTHPASYSVGIGVLSRGGGIYPSRREVYHSPPSNAKTENK
jgi:hypothetical protein